MRKKELLPDAVRFLEEAGWKPGRDVSSRVDDWIEQIGSTLDGPDYPEPPDAVIEILTEFGGLHVLVSGPGRTMMRHPFLLDPRENLLSPAAYRQLSEVCGSTSFPLGVLEGEQAALAGDARGRVLLITSVGEMLVGSEIHDALNNLIVGIRPEPL